MELACELSRRAAALHASCLGREAVAVAAAAAPHELLAAARLLVEAPPHEIAGARAALGVQDTFVCNL